MARILVIEDNPDNLELMTYLLRAFGHVTYTALDGEVGVATAELEQPDLIVCDIHLPKLDGYQVAQQLKSNPQLAGVPLVAVTAFAMVGDRDRILAAGFDDYITKPIAPDKFVGQLENRLSQALWGQRPLPMADTPNIDAPPTRARLLVVDDSRVNRELLQQTLEPFGYQTLLAGSVAEALALLAELTPDLILSDLHMPNEDGFNFIRQVKANSRLARLPFIFISSSIWGNKDRETALQLGADLFILRPIEPQALLERIATVLPLPRGYRDGDHPDC